MRAHRVLGDEEPLRNLVGAEVLVEQEENLELAGREGLGDGVGNSLVGSPVANPLEEAARDRTRERSLALGDAVQELDDPLRRFGLEQVAGGTAANGGEEVVLGP